MKKNQSVYLNGKYFLMISRYSINFENLFNFKINKLLIDFFISN